MTYKFSWKQDIKKVDWGSTLKYNLMRAVSAGIVWGFLMIITDPGKNALPALFAPIFFPILYLLFSVIGAICALLLTWSPFPFAELVAGLLMILCAFIVAVGDPLIYLIQKRKPEFVPIDQPRLCDFHLIVFILRNEFFTNGGIPSPISPTKQVVQVSVPSNSPANSSPQSTPPSSVSTMPIPAPVASGSFFTSKPFIMLVGIGAVLLGGVTLFKSISESTVLSYSLTLDGKELPSGKVPDVKVDGQPFMKGNKINIGWHTLTVQLQDAEPLEKHYWVLFGAKNLGALPLESCKGSLVVSVTPSPATVIVQSLGQTVSQGPAPLTLDKLPVGNYSLVIKRREYEENRAVVIQRRQRTEAKVDLNLGGVVMCAEPADAEFDFSGNSHHWQGKLPIRLDDVPVGKYSLLASRKGWDISSAVSVVQGQTTTNRTEFQYGSIGLTSDPAGLVISTNGVEVGETPLVLREVRPGRYSLTASDGENDLIADVSVAPNEAAKHNFVFHYGMVQLTSIPAGATVIRKGKEVGKTPLPLNHIPDGEIMVELRLQGYIFTNFAIKTVEGITSQLSVKLIGERYLQTMKQARDAFAAGQFAQSQNYLVLALSLQPDDSAAMQLRDEVAQAVAEGEKAKAKAAEAARAEQANAKAREMGSLAWLNYEQVISDCTKYIGNTYKFDCTRWKVVSIEKDGTIVFRTTGSRDSLQYGQDEIRAKPSAANQGEFLSVKNSQLITIKARVKSLDLGDLFSRVLRRIFLEDAELLEK